VGLRAGVDKINILNPNIMNFKPNFSYSTGLNVPSTEHSAYMCMSIFDKQAYRHMRFPAVHHNWISVAAR
jgi:hypothetical protein